MISLPFISTYDPPGTSEGTLDPLGLYLLADQLATHLVPSVRERMQRIRFLTAATVGSWLTEDIEPNPRYPQLPPFLVWEWLVVEAIVRSSTDEERAKGVPGNQVTRNAIDRQNYLDERSYLKTARVFGFHGIYKRLGIHLGLFDTHFRFRSPHGEELIRQWARDQGYGTFDSGQPQFEKWRRAVVSSLAEFPVRTKTVPNWNADDWRELADAFMPDGMQRYEKRCLRQMLLRTGDDQLGAFVDIWNLLAKLREEQTDELTFHELLETEAPHLAGLLQGMTAYELFCRCLTNAFDLIRRSGSQHDTRGLLVSSLSKNDEFTQLAEQSHALYSRALQRCNEANLSAEQGLIDRFGRFAEPLPPVEFAHSLCEHHEHVQKAKSRDGKRSWFDRISEDRIYVRPKYRLKGDKPVSDGYVHDYRLKPIQQFYRDLK